MRISLKATLQGIIHGYSCYISPLLPAHCRFYPSCSHYMYEAIEHHGLSGGTYLGVRRILKCHPWHPGGIDPVPPCHKHNPSSSSGRT